MVTTITCHQLQKTFEGDGAKTYALKSTSLTFEKDDFIAIIGPSGSGKSTLLSLIGTLDQPSSGTIQYDGEEIANKSKNALADFRFEEIGFIFQQYHLLPTLTVLENVLITFYGRKVSYDKLARAKEVLTQVGLQDKFHALPSQLSGGQQQRVAIARAIVHQPSWLLADEPTGNLDSETGETIFQLLTALHEEHQVGIIYVTHDPKLAVRAKRIITMKDGAIIDDTQGVLL